MEKGEQAAGIQGDNNKVIFNELPNRQPRSATKKRGNFSIFRAAASIVHRKSSSKKVTAPKSEGAESGTSDGTWKNLVDGMRPLHIPHQLVVGTLSPPPPPPVHFLRHDSFHDVLLPPPSPCSSVDGMSRYASAEDLRLLDNEGDEVANGEEANAINVRAEEFIAKFYEQIRIDSFKLTEQD